MDEFTFLYILVKFAFYLLTFFLLIHFSSSIPFFLLSFMPPVFTTELFLNAVTFVVYQENWFSHYCILRNWHGDYHISWSLALLVSSVNHSHTYFSNIYWEFTTMSDIVLGLEIQSSVRHIVPLTLEIIKFTVRFYNILQILRSLLTHPSSL